MSAPPGSEKCEPNLTPLLDLVLQLIMFFMLTANFDKYTKNQQVRLPKAAQALAPDKSIEVQLLVEIASPKKDEADPKKPAAVGKWSLNARPVQGPSDLFEKLKVEAEQHGVGKHADAAGGKPRAKKKVAVILRVDKDVPFRQLYEAMLKINQAGFEDVQLRAEKSN